MKDSVLDSYEKVSLEYIGNSNSLHKLGLNSKKLEDAAGKQILDVLGLRDYEVIYTSGNAESFSTIFLNTKDKVWTDNEDINDIGIEMGLDVSFLGDYSLDKEKCFVSTRNEENSFGKFNHIDISLDNSYSRLNDFDFITIEDDIPFFGVLLKKKNIDIVPLVNGGKSSTKYRSGTAATPLIVSFAKLVKLKYKK